MAATARRRVTAPYDLDSRVSFLEGAYDGIQRGLDRIVDTLDEHRAEARTGIGELKSALAVGYDDHEQRLRDLEGAHHAARGEQRATGRIAVHLRTWRTTWVLAIAAVAGGSFTLFTLLAAH
jgi:hypothetical protein